MAGGKAPLDQVLGEEVGRVLEAIHRDHGVRMTSTTGGGLRGRRPGRAGGRPRTVCGSSCDFVVLGLGVEPVVRCLEGSGIRSTTASSSTSGAGPASRASSPPATSPTTPPGVRPADPGRALAERREHGRAAASACWDARPRTTRSTGSGRTSTTTRNRVRRLSPRVGRPRGPRSIDSRSFAAFYVLGGRVQSVVSVDPPRSATGWR